jgi:hypothetical protein
MLRNGEHIIIVGVPGSGKSTWARRLVAAQSRVIYFDVAGDYENLGLGYGSTSRIAKCYVPNFPGDDFFSDRFKLTVLAERLDWQDVRNEFIATVRLAKRVKNLTLLADEVGDYKTGPSEQALKALHRNGHKDGIISVLVSQRFVDIPLGCRATATAVYSFLQDNADDLQALHEQFDTLSPGFAERVRNWKPGEPPVAWQRIELYHGRGGVTRPTTTGGNKWRV